MTLYKKLLEFRFYIGLALLAVCAVLAFVQEWNWFFLTLFFALFAIITHMLFGPLRLIQEAVQAGDMEEAQRFIKMVQFPKLLIKPVRQGFYMLQSNMAMQNKDFASAEDLMKKSIKSKSKVMGTENEGASYLQLGMIAMQNGKKSEGRKNLRLALEKGLPDKESKAAAYLQLASLEIQSRRFKQGRDLFQKAKKLKPQTSEIKMQIAEMEKYIHRVR